MQGFFPPGFILTRNRTQVYAKVFLLKYGGAVDPGFEGIARESSAGTAAMHRFRIAERPTAQVQDT